MVSIWGNFLLESWRWVIYLVNTYVFGINGCDRIINLLKLNIYNLAENSK
jgi:hypothetical protein